MNALQIAAEIDSQIRRLLPGVIGPITPASVFEELGMDSLNRVDLLAAAEMSFDIEVPDEAVGGLVRVQDLVELVQSLTARVA